MTATAEMQVPMVWYKIIGREELLLSGDPNSRSRAQLAMLTAYDAPQEGMRLFVDGVEKGAFPRSVLIEPGSHVVEFQNLAGKRVDAGRMTFRKEQVYSVGRVRNALNGGLHQISLGYAHVWMPAENASSLGPWPSAPGARLAWVGRVKTRSPLLRRLGIGADITYNQFRVERSLIPIDGRIYAPKTSMLEIGFGPLFRLDVPFVLIQIQPRASVVNLFRHGPGLYEFSDGDGTTVVDLSASTPEEPFQSWIFGALGADFALGVRPINRLSVQVHYSPMVFNAALTGEPKTEFFQRLAVVIEVGL
jgi:hypothetical protein